ncbi:MAG: T9SS type A sorting domain-containing protein [Ignavibacteria bacterium]|nr:T9SS type A sorting domain-containing protein [Ignavibacteria bacterium]
MKNLLYSFLVFALMIYTSNTASQWQIVSSGGAVAYNSISFYQSWGFAGGDLGLIKKTVDHGSTWTTLSLGATTKINDVYTYNNVIAYLCGVDGMIYKTPNGGLNWTAQTTAAAYRYYDLDFINSTTGMVVGDDGRAGFTTNGGTNWLQAQLNVSPGAKLDYKVCDMIDMNTWLVASADTQISNIQYSYLHRTTNNGASYQNVYTMVGGLTNDVSFMYLRVMTSTTIYAVSANGYFLRSINNGTTWTAIQLPTIPLAVDFANMSTGYYCGQNGVIRKTTNGGINWIEQTSPTTQALKTIFCKDTSNIYAAGNNGTIVRTQNGGNFVGVNPAGNEIPETFSLNQNYPNPFNPSTRISFDIPVASFVNLTVYNILGKDVKILVNENLNAGKFEAEFDAADLPGGIYFYRLNAGKYTETRKMILVK